MDKISTNLIIIVLTCVVSYTAFNNAKLMDDWILSPFKAQRSKQYYRYITYGFLHADGMHLLFNMITLYFFGRVMEGFYTSVLGPFGFALFYLGGLVFSVLPSALQNQKDPRYATLGASGAVSAVLFAFILFEPWTTLVILVFECPAIIYAILYVAYSIWRDKKGGDNINHSAHLWGAAYGIAATLLIQPSVLNLFINKLLGPFS
ncbi:MAG: rhomboid family intramembrane serine protease [Arenimonas sp.]